MKFGEIFRFYLYGKILAAKRTPEKKKIGLYRGIYFRNYINNLLSRGWRKKIFTSKGKKEKTISDTFPTKIHLFP